MGSLAYSDRFSGKLAEVTATVGRERTVRQNEAILGIDVVRLHEATEVHPLTVKDGQVDVLAVQEVPLASRRVVRPNNDTRLVHQVIEASLASVCVSEALVDLKQGLVLLVESLSCNFEVTLVRTVRDAVEGGRKLSKRKSSCRRFDVRLPPRTGDTGMRHPCQRS